MATTGIYKITSPTGKVYIGQSWNIEIRKSYCRGLRCKGQPYICNSLTKHGWNNHIFEIIHELPADVNQEIMDNYEILYWQLYKELGIEMLNIKEPGSRGKHNAITKQIISEKALGNTRTLGLKHSKETIALMIKSAIARPERSQETRLKMSLAKQGQYLPGAKEHNERTKDRTIYTFVHEHDLKTFTGIRSTFEKEGYVHSALLSQLVKHKILTAKGWRVYETA